MKFQKSISIILLPLIISIFVNHNVTAAHIIGGEFSYTCLGDSPNSDSILFEITYNVFVNCGELNPDGILFLAWKSSNEAKIIEIYFDYQQYIQNVTYNCTELPPNLCVEQWVYKSQVELPSNTDTLIISNTDCCRPGTLVNITGVEDEDFGASHIIEILPIAKEICNNSPTFETFPPTFICVNEPLELEHIAIDDDGDQLVYEFCEVYAAHSIFGGGFPPFPALQYLLPEFSPFHPLGQNVLSIDPNTGTISGLPLMVGAYVLGICVSEYRNGEFLGQFRRDIQLNIGECNPNVVANIDGGTLQTSGEYTINSCFNKEISFLNSSTDSQYITTVNWNFSNDIHSIYDTIWNPVIAFPEAGTYNSNLILNENGECSDTFEFILNIVEDIVPEFSATYDTCISGPVQFNNNAYAIGSELTEYKWSFGDGTLSGEFEPLKIFEFPGNYQVQLYATDEFGCMDSFKNMINWQPAPAIIIVSPETAADCAPLTTTFNNLSWPIDSNYIFNWNFGDETLSSHEMNPNHEYLNPGIYDLSISIESPLGCVADTTFQDLIFIESPPVANFTYAPQIISQISPEIQLIDNSENTVQWQWYFGDIDSSYIQEPNYIFGDTGLHHVKLIVKDIYGCVDSMIQIVDILPKVTYFLPNAFSPNGDGVNDTFHGKGNTNGMLNFELQIFDRWGEVLFSSTDPYFEWNGNHAQNQALISKGVYVFQLTYITRRGEKFQEKGYITLIR